MCVPATVPPLRFDTVNPIEVELSDTSSVNVKLPALEERDGVALKDSNPATVLTPTGRFTDDAPETAIELLARLKDEFVTFLKACFHAPKSKTVQPFASVDFLELSVAQSIHHDIGD